MVDLFESITEAGACYCQDWVVKLEEILETNHVPPAKFLAVANGYLREHGCAFKFSRLPLWGRLISKGNSLKRKHVVAILKLLGIDTV
jgi:hypothetical protein